MIGRLIASVLLAGAVAACSGSHSAPDRGGGGSTTVAARSIDEVLALHDDSLLALPGVVGTAVALCDGERCIKVLLADANPDTRSRIPTRLDGYRVVVEVTGTIRPR
jgi:hypothetical protein